MNREIAQEVYEMLSLNEDVELCLKFIDEVIKMNPLDKEYWGVELIRISEGYSEYEEYDRELRDSIFKIIKDNDITVSKDENLKSIVDQACGLIDIELRYLNEGNQNPDNTKSMLESIQSSLLRTMGVIES